MERRYFGTDGVRGRVGQGVITPEFMLKLGWAAGRVLAGEHGGRVVIGKDTRISGYMFESALEAGLSAAGMDIRLLGPMPTPAIAYLTRTLHAAAGIVISASHNPFYDNGIKFFSADGTKLPDEVELAIEAELDKPMTLVSPKRLGKAVRVEDASGRYIEFCKASIPQSMNFRGMKIVVDCANGATYRTAPSVFSELGAEVISLCARPDGTNINADCGSTKPQMLVSAVLENGADVGIALDGDGDRVIMVDNRGRIIDGDEILYVLATDRKEAGRLSGNTVVGTLMTNLGLEHALRARGIDLARAKVGDRYVMEMLRNNGWMLGGESSGHIICLEKTTTGDGVVAALQVLAAVQRSGRSLHELLHGVNKYPQTMINVPVEGQVDVNSSVTVTGAVKDAEAMLADRGRVLLRASGTEPLVRVMVEGRDAIEVEQTAQDLANVVQAAFGAA
ncbi:MAG: phosphoglucosamine mutase [Gammaproteobacteria bacterium]|nr:phosphoglucosamine mutase [Gammaproteobacteria bacterium]MCP5137815.1 phosphoglucosamine mutase [Gammaproteobacteria bacterium]